MDSFIHLFSSRRWPMIIQIHRRATMRVMAITRLWSVSLFRDKPDSGNLILLLPSRDARLDTISEIENWKRKICMGMKSLGSILCSIIFFFHQIYCSTSKLLLLLFYSLFLFRFFKFILLLSSESFFLLYETSTIRWPREAFLLQIWEALTKPW